ncbi:MAG: TonB-dependent receptor plug domain-containing protein, partial [Bacteroidales bacterium]
VIAAQTLSVEKLELLNSFSVADAIRYFSGVQIKDYGGVGGIKTVNIRSMGTNQVGVFYDGIQLGNAQNGMIDLGKFSLDNMEEISMYNGEKSEIFQSAKDYGSAGSIYLRTRRPRFEDGVNNNFKVSMSGGSFGLANPSFLWEHQITPYISSTLNVEYTYATGKYKFNYNRVYEDGTVAWDTTAVRQNGDISALRLEGGLHGFMDHGKWHVKGYYYDSERGIPGAIVNNVWEHSQRQWDRNFFTQGSFQQELFKGYDLMINAKYANDYMRYLNPDTTLMYIDNEFNQQEVYISVVNKYSIFKNWDISLSADYQWNTLDADLTNFVYPVRNTLLVSAATAFNWHRFNVMGSLLGSFIYDNATSIDTKSKTEKLTPAIFASYQPFKITDFQIRTFYKKIFRMPTFNDLYYTDIGNIALNPEYTTQYDLGLVYRKGIDNSIMQTLELNVDAYFNQVTDKIIAVPSGSGQYRWMMINLGYVEIRGLDLRGMATFQLPYDIWANVSLNYTYQKAQDFTDPTDIDTYGGQIAYIPWHSGSVVAQMGYKSWSMNYSFIYVGERYHSSENILTNYEQPWYTHDMTVSKEFRFKKIDMTVAAEMNNIFNQQYDVVLNYPMPGRNYKCTVTLKF